MLYVILDLLDLALLSLGGVEAFAKILCRHTGRSLESRILCQRLEGMGKGFVRTEWNGSSGARVRNHFHSVLQGLGEFSLPCCHAFEFSPDCRRRRSFDVARCGCRPLPFARLR